MSALRRWGPVVVLSLGCLITVGGVKPQRAMQLRAPLAETIPAEMYGRAAQEVTISEEEQRVAGMSSYVMRWYQTEAGHDFSVYVGYYPQQSQGKTIHSPRNCLPGGGWEPLGNRLATLQTAHGPVQVNEYLLRRKDEQVVVFYWYQGRGRVENNEYRVKWNLLLDSALHGRSEESLVRVMVPVTTSVEEARAIAVQVSEPLVAQVGAAMPAGL